MSGVRFRAPASVTDEAALAVLEPVIRAVASAFHEAGLARLDGLEIQVTRDAGDSGRHYAACREDGRLILLSPDLIGVPEATATGIIAHELGHAADFLYPAQFVSAARGGLQLLDATKKGVPAGEAPVRPQWLADWQARGPDEVERMADRIAEAVLGVRIGYAGPCLLQTVGRGISPRPRGLR